MLLVACGDDDVQVPDSSVPDTGSLPVDSGTGDGGGSDVGAPMDAGGVEDAGAADVPATDAGPRGALCPMTEMCNPVLQTGCAAMEGCYVAGNADSAMTVCAPAGSIAMGAACTTADGCVSGTACIGGTCQPLCCGASDADCPAGGVCRGLSNLEGIGVCLLPDGCNLLTQTGCEAMEGCYPLSPEGGTRCDSGGSAAPGAACEASNDCASGAICLDDGLCHSLCAMGSDTCGEMQCAPLNGFDDVGVCVTPS